MVAAPGRQLISLIATTCLLSSCEALDRLEVCREAPPSQGVNRRFDGQQAIGSSEAAGRLPNGDTLVIFLAQVGQRSVEDATELRAARLSPDGLPLKGCKSVDGLEDTIVAVDPAAPAPQRQLNPAFSPPATNALGRDGLLVYAAKEGTAPWTLRGESFDTNGCPRDKSATSVGVFTIAEASADADLIGNVSVARMGDESADDDRFVVAWVEYVGQKGIPRGRLIRLGGSGPTFMPTEAAPDGSAVELPLLGHVIAALQAVRTGPDGVAIAWMDSQLGSERPAITLFDGFLKPAGVSVWLDDSHVVLPRYYGRRVAAAFDGTHLLVTWTRSGVDANDPPRLMGRALDLHGMPLTTAPIKLGASPTGEDGFASAAGLPGGGFMAAWRQTSGAASTDPPTLRVATLDTRGNPSFNDVACREKDVAMVSPRPGDDVIQSAFAVGADGKVMVAFTASGSGWDDPSQTSVRSVILNPKTFFPGGRSLPAHGGGASATPTPLPTVRIPTAGPCTEARAGQPAMPCKCDGTCDLDGQCLYGSLISSPGGMCFVGCSAGNTGVCGAQGTCTVVGMTGFCEATCGSPADCPAGRACHSRLGTCIDFCARDSDCEPDGLCDPYKRTCVSTLSAGGGGLFAPCRDDIECRSNRCGVSGFTKGHCRSYCRKDVAPCPDDGVCIPYAAESDLGECFRPCEKEGFCFAADQVCYPVSSLAPDVCVAF